MKILVDADACPVVDTIVETAKTCDTPVILVKSHDHYSKDIFPSHVKTIYVDPGFDASDYKIIKLADANDIVVTQDYGLASLLLTKKCHVIHHNGFLFTEDNIDRFLLTRHLSAQMRRAGQRTKGPKPYTNENRNKFKALLFNIICSQK